MANVLHTFDINKFLVIFGGTRLSGFVEGTFLEVEFDDDSFQDQAGVDGEVCRVQNAKAIATATVHILQSSGTNDILSGYFLADKSLNAPLPFLVKDMSGRTVLESTESWILRIPPLNYAEEVQSREWQIRCAKLVAHVGGNF